MISGAAAPVPQRRNTIPVRGVSATLIIKEETMKTILKALTLATALSVTAGSVLAEGVSKIGLAVPNLQADFFNQIKLGVEGYAAKLGIEVITVDAKNDTATQVNQVQDLITQGIDAFIYIPAGAAAAAVPTRPGPCRGPPGH